MSTKEQYDKKEVFQFLEDLRESGATNMFGAAPYLEDEFGMTRADAREWLREWMGSYSS